jgi:hypothetical protein
MDDSLSKHDDDAAGDDNTETIGTESASIAYEHALSISVTDANKAISDALAILAHVPTTELMNHIPVRT